MQLVIELRPQLALFARCHLPLKASRQPGRGPLSPSPFRAFSGENYSTQRADVGRKISSYILYFCSDGL